MITVVFALKMIKSGQQWKYVLSAMCETLMMIWVGTCLPTGDEWWARRTTYKIATINNYAVTTVLPLSCNCASAT